MILPGAEWSAAMQSISFQNTIINFSKESDEYINAQKERAQKIDYYKNTDEVEAIKSQGHLRVVYRPIYGRRMQTPIDSEDPYVGKSDHMLPPLTDGANVRVPVADNITVSDDGVTVNVPINNDITGPDPLVAKMNASMEGISFLRHYDLLVGEPNQRLILNILGADSPHSVDVIKMMARFCFQGSAIRAMNSVLAKSRAVKARDAQSIWPEHLHTLHEAFPSFAQDDEQHVPWFIDPSNNRRAYMFTLKSGNNQRFTLYSSIKDAPEHVFRAAWRWITGQTFHGPKPDALTIENTERLWTSLAIIESDEDPPFTMTPWREKIMVGDYVVIDNPIMNVNAVVIMGNLYKRTTVQVDLVDFKTKSDTERMAALNGGLGGSQLVEYYLTDTHHLAVLCHGKVYNHPYIMSLAWDANDGVGVALGLREEFKTPTTRDFFVEYRQSLYVDGRLRHHLDIQWWGNDSFTFPYKFFPIERMPPDMVNLSDILQFSAATNNTDAPILNYDRAIPGHGSDEFKKTLYTDVNFLQANINPAIGEWAHDNDIVGILLTIENHAWPIPPLWTMFEESAQDNDVVESQVPPKPPLWTVHRIKQYLVHKPTTPRTIDTPNGYSLWSKCDVYRDAWTNSPQVDTITLEEPDDAFAVYVNGNYFRTPPPPLDKSMWLTLYRRRDTDYVPEYATSFKLPEGSYKFPNVLLEAITTQLTAALVEQYWKIVLDKRRHGVDVKLVIKDDNPLTTETAIQITYDEATAKFHFKPGTRFDAVSIMLSPNLARLLGFDTEETRFSIISDNWWNDNPNPPKHTPTIAFGIRMDIVGFDWLNGDLFHLICQSKYPARLSLGVNQVFVESNLVEPIVYINGRYRPVLACVDIDFTKQNYQTYVPEGHEQIVQKLRTESMAHATFKLVDAFGDKIKLVGMSEDSVKIVISLKRVA